jgi:hypothetical protein
MRRCSTDAGPSHKLSDQMKTLLGGKVSTRLSTVPCPPKGLPRALSPTQPFEDATTPGSNDMDVETEEARLAREEQERIDEINADRYFDKCEQRAREREEGDEDEALLYFNRKE